MPVQSTKAGLLAPVDAFELGGFLLRGHDRGLLGHGRLEETHAYMQTGARLVG